MLGRIRRGLSYANVMATIAVFGVLATGGAYAASQIGPKDIKKNAVRAKHIKKQQIKAKHVKKNAVRTKHIRDGAVSEAKLAEGALAGLEARIGALEGTVAAQAATIAGLGGDVSALQALLAGVSRQSIQGHDTLRFAGMNLQVVNGTGTTDGTPNGLGNLIVGYSAEPTIGPARTGSHYLVVGDEHEWTAFGGILAGPRNTASGNWASVTGGSGNTASAPAASVTGGFNNTASGTLQASVTGGSGNTASGLTASVSGGGNNTASGFRSSILGGSGVTEADSNECGTLVC